MIGSRKNYLQSYARVDAELTSIPCKVCLETVVDKPVGLVIGTLKTRIPNLLDYACKMEDAATHAPQRMSGLDVEQRLVQNALSQMSVLGYTTDELGREINSWVVHDARRCMFYVRERVRNGGTHRRKAQGPCARKRRY